MVSSLPAPGPEPVPFPEGGAPVEQLYPSVGSDAKAPTSLIAESDAKVATDKDPSGKDDLEGAEWGWYGGRRRYWGGGWGGYGGWGGRSYGWGYPRYYSYYSYPSYYW